MATMSVSVTESVMSHVKLPRKVPDTVFQTNG